MSLSPPLGPFIAFASMDAINLDDVLDASFIDCSDTSSEQDRGDDSESITTEQDPSATKHLKSLNRWDLISVGAFRRTREAGVLSDGNLSDFSSIVRNNPMNGWGHQSSDQGSKRQGDRSQADTSISPILLPHQEKDGERTPTARNGVSGAKSPSSRHRHAKRQGSTHPKYPLKPPNSSPNQRHQHHHTRQHHPNSKTRSTSGSQRMNSIPSLSI
jgi:hypothetical protein